MTEKAVRLNVKLTGEDAEFWRALKAKIGSNSDVGVFYFMFAQYKELVSNEIKLLDIKEVREAYANKQTLDDNLKQNMKEISDLRKEVAELQKEVSKKG